MYLKIATTIPLALAIAACGEPIDGSDTADLTNDAVTADTGVEGESTYDPNEDGPLQSDAILDDAVDTTDAAAEDTEGMAEEPVM